jgi:hypothetical protein
MFIRDLTTSSHLLLWFSSTRIERRGGAMADGGEAPSSACGVPNSDLILPKRSRRLGFLVLLTFGSGNNWQKAGDGSAFFLTSAGVEEFLRWTSGLKNRMRTFLVAPSCSLSYPIAQKDDKRSSSKVTYGSACSLICG